MNNRMQMGAELVIARKADTDFCCFRAKRQQWLLLFLLFKKKKHLFFLYCEIKKRIEQRTKCPECCHLPYVGNDNNMFTVSLVTV